MKPTKGEIMKKIGNYWVDNHNNKWNYSQYSKLHAKKLSETLNNCVNCTNCFYCSECSECSRCSGCSKCSMCFDCSNCSMCSGCSRCSGYKQNPKRIESGLIGSRKSTTYIYWTDKTDIQVVCGCFSGDLKEFEKQVKKTYPSGQHHNEYIALIKVAKHAIKNL